jgi:polysaccharide biosynthesis PFTS motif protein
VTPFCDDWLSKHGIIRNYISFDNAKKFIDDVLEVSSSIEHNYPVNIEIALKPKRNYGPPHSQPYIDYIHKLNSSNLLRFVEPDFHIGQLISDSDVVCVFPYSSPVFVARHLSVPSFWYDPTGLLRWNFHRREFPIIQGTINLYSHLLSILDA